MLIAHPFFALLFACAVAGTPVQVFHQDAPAAQPTVDTTVPVPFNLQNAKFIAGLFWATPGSGAFRQCSASVIASTVLVTSAACANAEYARSLHGPGQWLIAAGSDKRYMPHLPDTAQEHSVVKSIDVDSETNFAIIELEAPLELSDSIRPIVISTQTGIPGTANLNMYNTTDLTYSPFVKLMQGTEAECKGVVPGYPQDKFFCTMPVRNQSVFGDRLGGDPIVGYTLLTNAPTALLVGITGSYYSKSSPTLAGQKNDPSAYRFNSIVAAHIERIASAANASVSSIANAGPLA
ncbi:hypothetical protein GQ54DRAFT_303375 [Martensiomyces pterosporus]|nr:hypothetical protein GQ54DRAFT_303375 [Martensiomyces pterosporus]